MNPINQGQVNPYRSAYRAEIDGLRAFAVLSVIAFHAFPSLFKGGFIGVDVFFVISGFLITSHIFEKLSDGQFSFTGFFGRRIRRIFPALILVMASSLAFGWFVLLADEYAQLGKHVAGGAAFILNFILVGESGYFDNAAETKPMLHLWSLAVEEQFYIIWPLVLWFAWKRQFNLLTITLVVAIVSFYLNLRFAHSKPIETFFWPVGRFWELLSGSVLAWLLLYKRELLSKVKLWVDKYLVRIIRSKEVLADGSTVANIMSFIGLLLLVYGVIRIDEGLAFPSTWALIPVLGALFVISAGSKAWFNRVFLMNPIAVWFGLISYPLYLWHWPILSFLQIIDGELPHRDARVGAVLISIFLAWITYKFIEAPIRFGRLRKKISAPLIALALLVVGVVGYFITKADLSESHGFEDVIFEREGFEHTFGTSLKWYKGIDDWLFLGNDHSDTVAKHRLAIKPDEKDIAVIVAPFSTLVEAASKQNIQVALLVGPDKSSIYTEYLPKEFMPSEKRYITFFTDKLLTIPNLIVQDPTNILHQSKSSEGFLYYRTDSHWNYKGSYISFRALIEQLGLKLPKVNFTLSNHPFKGGLMGISELNDHPLHLGDNWGYKIIGNNEIVRQKLEVQTINSFGWQGLVTNSSPLNDMTVWVIGDSFTTALRPYLNATFKEVRYVGHWHNNMSALPLELQKADAKPDLVLVVKVERTF